MLDKSNARLVTVTVAAVVLLSLVSVVVLTLADKGVPETLADVLKTALGAVLALATVRAANPNPPSTTVTEGSSVTVTGGEPAEPTEPLGTAVIAGKL